MLYLLHNELGVVYETTHDPQVAAEHPHKISYEGDWTALWQVVAAANRLNRAFPDRLYRGCDRGDHEEFQFDVIRVPDIGDDLYMRHRDTYYYAGKLTSRGKIGRTLITDLNVVFDAARSRVPSGNWYFNYRYQLVEARDVPVGTAVVYISKLPDTRDKIKGIRKPTNGTRNR